MMHDFFNFEKFQLPQNKKPSYSLNNSAFLVLIPLKRKNSKSSIIHLAKLSNLKTFQPSTGI